MPDLDLQRLLTILAVALGAGLLLSLVGVAWLLWRVRRVPLPSGASFLTALQATPLLVVIVLDLLDFSLDIFSAPIAWAVLGYLGLAPLRRVTVVESLIPGTQFIPTMTLAWLLARWSARRA